MLIFIENLPRDTTLLELEEILGCEDLRVRYSSHRGKRKDESEFHCVLVNTENNEVGQNLIAQVSGLKLRNNHLIARPYIERGKTGGWQGENRRLQQLSLDFPENKVALRSL